MKELPAQGATWRPGKRACEQAVATALHNLAIIPLLRYTGVRLSEL